MLFVEVSEKGWKKSVKTVIFGYNARQMWISLSSI